MIIGKIDDEAAFLGKLVLIYVFVFLPLADLEDLRVIKWLPEASWIDRVCKHVQAIVRERTEGSTS